MFRYVVSVVLVGLTVSLPIGASEMISSKPVPVQDGEETPQEDGPQEEAEFVSSYLPTDLQFNPLESFTSTEAQIYTALYEGLVSYHPLTLDPVPAVAERWESSPDGLTYRFYFRPGARYSNGDMVTARHFRATWLELLRPENESAYSFLFDVIDGAEEYRTGEDPDPENVGIYAESAGVLRVELAHPASHFLDILCHHSFSALHPDMLEAEDWSELPEIIGNGPYKVEQRTGEELVLTKNDEYWDRSRVSIPKLRFIFNENSAELTQRFNDEEIDWVAGGMLLDRVKYEDTIQVNPLFATTYYFVNVERPGLDSDAVRRALALLLPWPEMRSPDLHFIPAETLVPQMPYYPDVTGITEQNVSRALALLEQAGFPEGRGLGPVVARMPQGAENDPVTTQMLEAWREHLEVDIDLETVPYDGYFESLSGDDYTVGQISWIADFADPLTFLQMWTSQSNLNDSGFASSEFDRLVRSSMSQTGNRRYQTLAEAEQLLLDSGVVLPISHSPAINLIDLNRVEGWYPNALDIHPFKYLEFSGRRPIPGTARLTPHALPAGLGR
jgi:peptide/nickel transport system substrate-binding protein/oligopeptide transport system substrate-binding protein